MDYEIILISGTVDFILNYLVQYLGADGGVGSKLEIQDGTFTGRIVDIHPYHQDKIEALQGYLGHHTVDYKKSFGFADSWADVPLLSLFGNPVVVNPGLFLRSMMRKRRWPVLSQYSDEELGIPSGNAKTNPSREISE
jgi:phosphoserine phosphatase